MDLIETLRQEFAYELPLDAVFRFVERWSKHSQTALDWERGMFCARGVGLGIRILARVFPRGRRRNCCFLALILPSPTCGIHWARSDPMICHVRERASFKQLTLRWRVPLRGLSSRARSCP